MQGWRHKSEGGGGQCIGRWGVNTVKTLKCEKGGRFMTPHLLWWRGQRRACRHLACCMHTLDDPPSVGEGRDGSEARAQGECGLPVLQTNLTRKFMKTIIPCGEKIDFSPYCHSFFYKFNLVICIA